MSDRPEKMFRKEISSLPDIFRFVAQRMSSLKVDESDRVWADLVVEELFTNTVKYSSGGRDVEIRIDGDEEKLRVRLTDFDVDAFDITKLAPRVDTTLPVTERTPGGLGLHLVRESSDAVLYEYANRNSVITVTKRLGR